MSFVFFFKRNSLEGYVVCDAQYNRVKVKAPQYVALTHLSIHDAKGMNLKNMLEIVKSNEGGEFLAYFPQFSDLYQVTTRAYEKFVNSTQNSYQKTMQTLTSRSTEITEQEFKTELRSNVEKLERR